VKGEEGGGGKGIYQEVGMGDMYAKSKGRGAVIFGVVVERSEEILDSG